MTGPPSPSRFEGFRFDRRVYLLASAAFIRSSGRSAAYVFLPLILYVLFGLSFLQVGLLTAVIVPVNVAGYFIGGSASDRIGRRPLAVLPPLIIAPAFVAIYLWGTRDLSLLVGIWAVQGLLIGLQGPAQDSMVGDVTTPSQRVNAFGFQRVMANAGFALSPALGGYLAGSYGLPIVFLMAAVTTFGEGILLLLFLRESNPQTRPEPSRPGTGTTPRFRDQLRAPFHDGLLLTLGLLGAGLALVSGQFGTPLALFLEGIRGYSYAGIGLLYSLNGILVVTLQIPISWNLRRRPLFWMAVGTTLYAVAFLVFEVGAAYAVSLLAITLLTLGEDVVSPLQSSLVSGLSGRKDRGSYYGAYNVFTNSARATAPAVGTLLLGLGSLGPLALWGSMAGLGLLVTAGFLIFERRTGWRAMLPSRAPSAEP
jgi:MFS family permease